MLSVVIKDLSQVEEGILYGDILELRLDLFSFFSLEALSALRKKHKIPMIFTLKSRTEFSEEERCELILQLLKLHPEYLDIERDLPEEFIYEVFSKKGHTKLILSHHDFEKTPKDLHALYENMRKIPADLYKISVKANTALDTMSLISFTKKKEDLIAVSMGPLGQISRILAPIVGSFLMYTSLDKGEMGQLSVKELKEKYRFASLCKKSKVYGLIGAPVEFSISDVTHNQFFQENEIDAVYVKINVQKDELASFLEEAKGIFLGLSVTMPLKEEVMKHLSVIDSEALAIGAVNTLVLENGSWKGYNTDGIGALTALEKNGFVLGKRVAVIGTGGAAKAIAYEAKKRGAILSIISRSKDKARDLEKRLQIQEQDSLCHDVVINCTPLGHPGVFITPGSIVMDIKTVPKESEFLLEAKKKGCTLVYGHSMFIEQAKGQFSLWFGDVVKLKALLPLQKLCFEDQQ